ncbi:MAG: hypothetical protein ACRDV9_07760 [Acidimicrobiia bacterium]
MRFVYLVTSGARDPVKISLPFHLALNGSVEVGHEVEVVLAGDATELVSADVVDTIEGLGLPALRDLMGKARRHAIPVHV